MSEAGHRALPRRAAHVRQVGRGAGASPSQRAGAPRAAKRGPADPAAMAQLAASMVPPPPPAWRRILSHVQHFWLLVAFIVVWQCVSVFGLRFNPQLDVMLLPPTAVFSAAVDLVERGVLMTHIFDSLYRVLLAVGTAGVIGIPLGLAMGWFPRFRSVVDPLLEFIRPILLLAWIPLSILWFGIGDAQIVYIIFLAAFFPIVLNSMAGARDIDTYLVRAGLSLGARSGELFVTVVLPGALPQHLHRRAHRPRHRLDGARRGRAVAAPSGLGYMINNARTLFRSDYILLGMVLIGALGLPLDYIMRGSRR